MINTIILIIYIIGVLTIWCFCFKIGVWIGNHVDFGESLTVSQTESKTESTTQQQTDTVFN